MQLCPTSIHLFQRGRVGAIVRKTLGDVMAEKKRERQRTIVELIGSHPVGSQEELRLLLEKHGLRITQATLSRDLRELGVVRAATEDGSRYRLTDQGGRETKPSLAGLLPQLFLSAEGVGELIVLRTLSSGAQPISEAIDAQRWPEVLGTVAGENTILIVCRSGEARLTLTERLERIARSG
jgi:transcriptional regulator of arginine metabolism